MGLIVKLRELLFPPQCIFCRRVIDEGHICRSCRASLPLCGKVQVRHEFFSDCAAPLRYEGRVRKCLLAYKFSGRRSYAEGLSELVAEAVRRELDGRFDVVTWAPVSAKRRRQRGFDQARLLAERTADKLGTPARELLKKTRDTRANSSLKGAELRRANVSGAYEATDRGSIRGARVLLIDDIVTTGATLSECSRVLLTAGAESVVCAAAAAAVVRR